MRGKCVLMLNERTQRVSSGGLWWDQLEPVWWRYNPNSCNHINEDEFAFPSRNIITKDTVERWADVSLLMSRRIIEKGTKRREEKRRESTIRNTLTRASPTATQHSHDSNQTAEVMFDSRGRFISATAWHHQLNTEINKRGLRELSPASSARSLRAGRNENRCQVWYDHRWCESPQGCTYWPVSAKVKLHKALNLSLDYLPLSLWHYNILIIIQIYLKIKGSHLPVTDSTRILSSAQSFKSLGCFPAKPQSCTHPPGRHTLQQFGPKITLTQWHSLCRCL